MSKPIHLKYTIKANKKLVWDALVSPKHISKWGGGPASMSAKKNEKFSLWGGDIHGKNIEVEKEKELIQEWFGGDWTEPSIAEFKLIEDGNNTIVELVHKNVPEDEHKDIKIGWDDFYLGPLKEYVEGLEENQSPD